MGDHYSMLHITELEADLARLRAENEALKTERDEALDRADELERNAEVVSEEFEKDCWKAMRRLLYECNFPWEDIDPAEGVTADSAEEHIKTTLDEMDKGEARQRARADAAEAKAARLETAMRIVCRHGRRRHGRLPTQFWGIIYLTPRDIRGRYLLMERIRRTLTRR